MSNNNLNIVIKRIVDLLINHIDNVDNAHTIETLVTLNEKDFVVNDNNNEERVIDQEYTAEIDPNLIKIDKTHMFLSQAILDEINNSISVDELNNKLDDLSKNLKGFITTRFNNLINSEAGMSAITLLSELLTDGDKKEAIDLLASKFDKIYDEHEKSESHLSEQDRINFNKLLKLVNEAYADWNAKPEDFNYIKNKPESLPANGGNCDTIKEKTLAEITKCKGIATYVIGNSTHDELEVDFRLDKENFDEIIAKLTAPEAELRKPGIIYIREGLYEGNGIIIGNGYDLTLIGSGTSTKLRIKNAAFTSCNLSNLFISNATVIISGESKINNVTFVDCDVIITKLSKAVIKDCSFVNGSIKYIGTCNNNIIKDNILTNLPNGIMDSYVGVNNIVKDNLYT